MTAGYMYVLNPSAQDRYYHLSCVCKAGLVPAGFSISTFTSAARANGRCAIGRRGTLFPLDDTDPFDVNALCYQSCSLCGLSMRHLSPRPGLSD